MNCPVDMMPCTAAPCARGCVQIPSQWRPMSTPPKSRDQVRCGTPLAVLGMLVVGIVIYRLLR